MEELSKRGNILKDVREMLEKLDSIIESDFYKKTDFDYEAGLVEIQDRLREWLTDEEDKVDHGY